MINQLALICGTDIPYPQLHTVLHQPTLKEIALIGEETFFSGVQCLLVNKNLISLPGNFDLSQLNNFHIFMMILQEKSEAKKKQAVQMVLSLILPDFNFNLVPNRSLILSKEDCNEAK